VKFAKENGIGHFVFVARKEPKFKIPEGSIFVQTPPKPDPTSFYEDFRKGIPPGTSNVYAIHAMGASVAPKGSTLRAVNHDYLVSVVEALGKLQEDGDFDRVAIANISSIAAYYFGQHPNPEAINNDKAVEYCKARADGDEAVLNSKVDSTTVRPGIILSSAENGHIDLGHKYSPSEMTPFHAVVTNGKQLQQPVHEDDLVEAMFNGLNKPGSRIVHAVGPDVLTQAEMTEFFAKLSGSKFRPIHLPYELVKWVAEHFPEGRLAPYAIEMLKQLEEQNLPAISGEAFKELLGKEPRGLADIFPPDEIYTLAKSPFKEHTLRVIQGMLKNPKLMYEFSKLVLKHGPDLCAQAIRQMLK
jgi:nucleoside-diphosphate-sugar epimerase